MSSYSPHILLPIVNPPLSMVNSSSSPDLRLESHPDFTLTSLTRHPQSLHSYTFNIYNIQDRHVSAYVLSSLSDADRLGDLCSDGRHSYRFCLIQLSDIEAGSTIPVDNIVGEDEEAVEVEAQGLFQEGVINFGRRGLASEYASDVYVWPTRRS